MDTMETESISVMTQTKKEYEWIVLSFDIGIKNLAYCMLGWIKEKDNYEIVYWDDVNLVPDLEEDYCQGVIKSTGKRCGKKASYLSKTNSKPYCKTHAKPVQLMQEIQRRKVAKISNQELNTLLVKKLDTLPHLIDCDEVMLEHQPSKNPTMKNLLFMLNSYFIIRGFVDKPDSRCKMINIRQINSEKKHSLYTGPAVECHLKNAYDRNKFYSKKYCQFMIKDQPKWLEFYNSNKKKDDLADCYLQGVWYLTKKFKQVSVKKNKSNTAGKTKISKNKNKNKIPDKELIIQPAMQDINQDINQDIKKQILGVQPAVQPLIQPKTQPKIQPKNQQKMAKVNKIIELEKDQDEDQPSSVVDNETGLSVLDLVRFQKDQQEQQQFQKIQSMKQFK